MNNDTMVKDTERLEMRIMLKKVVNSRMVEAVWVVNERVRDRVTIDGTTYSMNYGIASVVDRVVFLKRVGKASKEVQTAISEMIEKYPEAIPNIY